MVPPHSRLTTHQKVGSKFPILMIKAAHSQRVGPIHKVYTLPIWGEISVSVYL